ncbi:hypothetical protein FJTKL_11409 [Diaporthe vaccinii]|uniref:FAD-binding PCMH-type domain-containing protein n=1 Tax=Diaporthe vaccinii TaxID=105482 RepID=A0ABR4EH25_9PEZI
MDQSNANMTNPADIGKICCLALATAVGRQKVVSPGSTEYDAALHSYFSTQQASLQPSCIVLPQSAEDVSAAVKSLVQLQEDGTSCQFAVRSGGHTSWAGASNIQSGVVIDLGSFKTVELAADKSTVSVGVGAIWGDVYKALEPHGLSVNGGRASTVGVGGLTLGSGVSYTSPRHGWTCDAALQFQIVLADGSVVLADATTRPDLFRALKGGGNNLGIVTRITFETFKQGPVWSGTVYSLDSAAAEATIENFVEFNSATSYDEYASVMTSFVYNQARGLPVIANLLQYTKEVSGTPAAFTNFMAVPNIYNSTSIASIQATTEATAALNPGGVRSLTYAVTLLSTKEVIRAACDKWRAHYPTIKDVTSIIFSLVLEPLPPIMYQRHAATNILGLADRTEALVIAELSVSWANESDDALVNSTARALVDDIIAEARSLGGYDPYIFANYANKDQAQDVIGSYGSESVAFLRKVREEVDPKDVFTRMVPGGYKIPDH